MSLPAQFEELNERLKVLENRFSELGYDMTSLVQSEYKKKWKIMPQAETHFGMFTALCVDTIDPWKQNRVRFFSPLHHDNDTPVKSLPFADCIASFGGFDDSGSNWVPPAGSTLCIVFENGSREAPYYIGTTWHRDRGPDGSHNWKYNIDEYYRLHEGRRKGYYVGPDDGSQVFPPWNTENYNGYDIDSIADFENDPSAQQNITNPNIYGFKTNEKHSLKLVDGDYKANFKNKRIEMYSACGNYFIMKDDSLHSCGDWANPGCGGGNPYAKHKSECRPFRGPGTPQNNKCELDQTGIQLLSISGHSFIFDDSVESPNVIPKWENSMESFSYGDNNTYKGRVKIISSTGHVFEMSDVESQSELRGEENYIRLKSATGNLIELNDHTTGSSGCAGCPPNLAGSKRGITMQSTSNHFIRMIDEENEQCAPCRKEGGVPAPKAKKAYVQIRTGYGLEIMMKDEASQEETQSQHIQIFCPQKDNTERGPHIMRCQEQPSGPGMVFLRVGGNYICSTYDNHYTIVGDKDKNPSNKITIVSKNTVIKTEKTYFNEAELQVFKSKKIILLMAGEDCKKGGGEEGCQACIWPVLCLSPKGITISDRVYVSASPDARCADIMQLLPFHSCEKFEGCE